jgi:hypothetical protein
MPKPWKLWKVTQGWGTGRGPSLDLTTEQRPESKAKVYAIYVPNNVNNALVRIRAGRGDAYDHSDVWVDERDGHGWRLYERVRHTREGED